MWGIEFHEGTANALICGEATFEVRKHPNKSKLYRLTFGPNGATILTQSGDDWVIAKRNATPENIEDILPTREDFGFDWTYSDLILALTFFGEGYKLGEMHGFRSGRKLDTKKD